MSTEERPTGAAVAAAVLWLAVFGAASASGQTPTGERPPQPTAASDSPAPAPGEAIQAPAPASERDEADREIKKAEPDFAVIALPTTLRVPRHSGVFRLTHRFTRPLDVGSFGDLASDFFGLDGGAVIGFEFRYGIARGLQAGVYRTSDKTIELFGQYDLFQQGAGRPIGVNLLVAVEGLDNFTEEYSPVLGVIVSRAVRDRLALYAQPIWVGHTRLDADASGQGGDDHGTGTSTFMVGLGARARIGEGTYLTAEVAPRVAGYAPEGVHVSFGIEKRAGGHVFQLNVSNGVGSTPGQIARGMHTHGERFWFLGFNLSRKFY